MSCTCREVGAEFEHDTADGCVYWLRHELAYRTNELADKVTANKLAIDTVLRQAERDLSAACDVIDRANTKIRLISPVVEVVSEYVHEHRIGVSGQCVGRNLVEDHKRLKALGTSTKGATIFTCVVCGAVSGFANGERAYCKVCVRRGAGGKSESPGPK